MSIRVTDHPLVVVLWTQEGCDACESTVGPWTEIAGRYQSCLPSIQVDCGNHASAANAYRIKATPTIMVLRWGRASYRRLEGEVTAAEIEAFYQQAAVGLDCALPDQSGQQP